MRFVNMLSREIEKWMNENGGLKAMDALCRQHAQYLLDWAAKTDYLAPLIKDEAYRSYTTLTLEVTDPAVKDADISAALKATGLANLADGIKKYSSVKQNSLRIACFPFVDIQGTGEYQKLTAAVDEIVRQLRQEAVRKQLASEFAPTAEKVYSEFGELVTEAGKSLDESGIARNLGSILESTISILEPLGTLVNATLPKLGSVLSPIAGTLAWIADTANAAYALLTWDVDRWNTALGNNAANGQYSNMQKWMGYGSSGSGDGNYYNPETGLWEGNAFHASGTDYFRGGRTVVGENGPETVILPAGSRILNNQESRESTGGGVHIDKVVLDAKNVRDFTAAVNTFSNFRRIYRMGAKA